MIVEGDNSHAKIEHTISPQESIIVQQQKVTDVNELNDDHCFKCKKKGDLYCCDRCFRSFHKACIATKRFTKIWNCEYCNSHLFCLTCNLPQTPTQTDEFHPQLLESSQPSPTLICTICFRFVHQKCCDIPLEILASQNHFFKGSENYVCKGCFKQFGLRYVLSFSRHELDNEVIYYFVNINTRSPIHCGWFDEATLREAPRESLNQVEVFEVPTIDRVIRMKIPQNLKHLDIDDIINQLLLGICENETGSYGSDNNFYFLVGWEGGDYAGATWEDQHIIFKDNNISSCPQLVRYLLYRKLQLALRDKKPLPPIYELFCKYFPPPPLKIKDTTHNELLQHLKNNTAEVSYLLPTTNYNDTLDFMCSYFTEHYSSDLAQLPTLIISGGSLGRWERRLKELCYQLNVVVLKGSEQHLYELKMKDFTYETLNLPKFQLMLLPDDRWNKQKRYLLHRAIKFGLIIFDEQIHDVILDEFDYEQPLLYEKRMYFVDQVKNKNRPLIRHKAKQYIQIDIEQNAFVYDLVNAKVLTPEFQLVNKPIDTLEELQILHRENEEQYENYSKWKDLERVVFLQFVMTFGFNATAIDMFPKLLNFAKGTYAGDETDFYEFNSHSKRFLSALSNHKSIRRQYSKFYFFQIPGQYIYKRVVKLQKLKRIFDNCKHRPQMFPSLLKEFVIFQGSKAVAIGDWDSRHDFILTALILERGFGKWLQILLCKDWFKWSASCHFVSLPNLKRCTNLTYRDFLRKLVCVQESAEVLRQINWQEVLNERGYSLLKALGSD